MDELLTIADIARELDIPESTVRYYRDRFAEYIPIVGEGRKRRYRAEAMDIFRTIAEGMKNHLTAEGVENELNDLYPLSVAYEMEPQQTTAEPQQRSELAVMLAQALEQQNATIQQVATSQEELIREVEDLKNELRDSRKLQDALLRQRDDRLMANIKSALERKSRRPWWKVWG